MGRAVTIYDVARQAGVAPSTVSRTFARPGRVGTETAARVRAAADRLGYRANPVARALTSRRTKTLALVVSDITNPVYGELIQGAQDAALNGGYLTLVASTRESAALERSTLERVLPAVDGIVLAGSRMSDTAIRTIAKQLPVVVIDRQVSGVPSIVADSGRGMRLAVEHLVGLLHEVVVWVSGPEASWIDGARWRALSESAVAHGITVHRVGPVTPTVAGGVAAAAHVLEQPSATAVLAYNDQIAIGLLQELGRRRVRLPGDLSVIGFDNAHGADLVSPRLTTVAAPRHAEGSAAVGNLIALLDGARWDGHPVILPTSLVVRGSTAQRRRKRISPASGTTSVSGSAASSSRSTVDGSR